MKLVCIGVGGSGASCLETLLHVAALGLFPSQCEIVPVALDPDRGHPRISGMTTFLGAYQDLRIAGDAADQNNAGLFGARIARHHTLNSTKPADQESLYAVLGLADEARRAMAGLFFRPNEIGRPDSREFANGYYGRANAGVCFFADPTGKERLLTALRPHLLQGDSRVVLFGSAFGGTGAAGLVHVARSIRHDEQLRGRAVPIAIVQLEPYFKPAAPTEKDSRFVNLPSTFGRRTGAAYQFLENLAANANLPFDVLYPLGVRTPSVFPPEWFRRDQQDNPHLWIEYVAAVAARDFALNGARTSAEPELRVRRVAMPPAFGEPIATLRRLLQAALCSRAVLAQLVLPILRAFPDARAIPGHPWLSDILAESQLTASAVRAHIEASVGLLNVVLGHAGVLPTAWRTGTASWQDPSDRGSWAEGQAISDVERRRLDELTQRTRDSFPEQFLTSQESASITEMLAGADPAAMFDSYARTDGDARLPVRALYRWAQAGVATAVEQAVHGRRDYQLVMQEPAPGESDHDVPNFATISDDSFVSVAARDGLKRLVVAPCWKPAGRTVSAPEESLPQANEFPSIWAPAIIYRDHLYAPNVSEDARHIHMGLLFLALMKYQAHQRVPVFPFSLDHEGLRSVVHSTFPLESYKATYGQDEHVLALYLRSSPVFGAEVPRVDEVVGFFFPDTIVVPAASLSESSSVLLRDLGIHAVGMGLPGALARACSNWHIVLQQARIPDAETKGPLFLEYLRSFEGQAGGRQGVSTPVADARRDAEDRYTEFPLLGTSDGGPARPPVWIERLYQARAAEVGR